MPPVIRSVNIKSEMPSVEEARHKLIDAINCAKKDGVQLLKIIHGYGSSGIGGALKDALRKSLSRRKKEGVVSTIIHGEDWCMFNEHARELCDRYPFLRDDKDYNQENPGITVIEL